MDSVIDQSNWQEHESSFTGTCPRCGYSEHSGKCEFSECHLPAEWEGWYSVVDGLGLSSGIMRRMKVCDVHKHLLKGGTENSN